MTRSREEGARAKLQARRRREADAPWRAATIDRGAEAAFAWQLWSLDWPEPAPGKLAVTSRAIHESGDAQPAPDDPLIANQHTDWESNGQVTRPVRLA